MSFLRALATVVFIAIATSFGSLWGIVLRLIDKSGDRVLDLAKAWSGWVTSFAGVTIVVDNRASLVPGQPYVFMANHASTRTTQLYDRRSDEVTLDEVERVMI